MEAHKTCVTYLIYVLISFCLVCDFIIQLNLINIPMQIYKEIILLKFPQSSNSSVCCGVKIYLNLL